MVVMAQIKVAPRTDAVASANRPENPGRTVGIEAAAEALVEAAVEFLATWLAPHHNPSPTPV